MNEILIMFILMIISLWFLWSTPCTPPKPTSTSVKHYQAYIHGFTLALQKKPSESADQ